MIRKFQNGGETFASWMAKNGYGKYNSAAGRLQLAKEKGIQTEGRTSYDINIELWKKLKAEKNSSKSTSSSKTSTSTTSTSTQTKTATPSTSKQSAPIIIGDENGKVVGIAVDNKTGYPVRAYDKADAEQKIMEQGDDEVIYFGNAAALKQDDKGNYTNFGASPLGAADDESFVITVNPKTYHYDPVTNTELWNWYKEAKANGTFWLNENMAYRATIPRKMWKEILKENPTWQQLHDRDDKYIKKWKKWSPEKKERVHNFTTLANTPELLFENSFQGRKRREVLTPKQWADILDAHPEYATSDKGYVKMIPDEAIGLHVKRLSQEATAEAAQEIAPWMLGTIDPLVAITSIGAGTALDKGIQHFSKRRYGSWADRWLHDEYGTYDPSTSNIIKAALNPAAVSVGVLGSLGSPILNPGRLINETPHPVRLQVSSGLVRGASRGIETLKNDFPLYKVVKEKTYSGDSPTLRKGPKTGSHRINPLRQAIEIERTVPVTRNPAYTYKFNIPEIPALMYSYSPLHLDVGYNKYQRTLPPVIPPRYHAYHTVQYLGSQAHAKWFRDQILAGKYGQVVDGPWGLELIVYGNGRVANIAEPQSVNLLEGLHPAGTVAGYEQLYVPRVKFSGPTPVGKVNVSKPAVIIGGTTGDWLQFKQGGTIKKPLLRKAGGRLVLKLPK